MKSEYEKIYLEHENNHWWFVARRELIKLLLDRYASKEGKVVDIGCGSGQNIRFLREYNVIGLDNSEFFIKYAKKHNLNIIKGTFPKTPFKRNSFDIVLCLDLLEHVKDDTQGLTEIYRILKSNGLVIITVPAFSLLWGKHDEDNQHLRRYQKNNLTDLMKKFKIIRASYWTFSPFIPVLLVRKIFRGHKSDLIKHNRIVNYIFLSILRLEHIYLRYFDLPIGVSLFVVAQKN